MMFPYLELPLAIGYDGAEDKIVRIKLQPVKITAYHDGYNEAGMFVYVDNNAFQLALTMQEYEAKIAAYWQAVERQQNVKTKLKIIN